ncbi:MAG: ABC transporter permease [Clostridia bacterium]|nr:ABC transporter permease [Clostridia bacterium]
MQVFKLFFKILKANRILILIFVGVYAAILFGVIIPLQHEGTADTYLEQKCKFAIMDEDNSVLSRGLAESLGTVHENVEISSFDKETLQDELYNGNICTAVIIKSGFEDSFTRGDTEDYLTLYNVPTENKAMLFAGDVDEYLRYVSGYTAAGFSMNDACKAAGDLVGETADVRIITGSDLTHESVIQSYYKYLGWILILMVTSVITPILIALNDKKLRNRIECSSFHFSKVNGQILMASLLSGIGLVGIFTLLAKLYFGSALGGFRLALMSSNMLCYVIVALAIAFLISRITSNSMVINMVANVISLGMAFFCGIFVPYYLLGDGVQTVARFLPAYWYLNALNDIDGSFPEALPDIIQSFGLQLLFAAVIIVAAMVISNAVRESSSTGYSSTL